MSTLKENIVINCADADIPKVIKLFKSLAIEQEIPKPVIMKMNIVLDELLSNIVNHGGRNSSSVQIETTFELKETAVKVTIKDTCAAFNPFSDDVEPNLEDSIEDRALGGLGLHLVKQLTSSHSYKRQGKKNVVVVVKDF